MFGSQGDRSGGSEAEEDDDGTAESCQVVVRQLADPLAELGARHSGDLVDHQTARLSDSCCRIGIDRYPKQWSIGLVSGERTDRDGRSRVEEIILNNDNRSWFADVAVASSSGPDLTALHSSLPSASMKA